MTFFGIYTQSSPNDWFYTPLLAISIVAATAFVVSGIIYLVLLSRRRLNPLDILDDIRCTYWTLEKELQVRWHICDYSGKFTFQAGYSARFKDGQEVDKEGDLKLDFYRAIDKDCLNGRKFWLEMYIRDVIVNEPNECEITLITKPYGRFWIAKQKTKPVKVLVVKHG